MRYWPIIILSLLTLSCNEKKPSEVEVKVIARVGDDVLTEKDLKALLNKDSSLDSKRVKSFVEEWIRNTLFYLAAKREGLEQDSDVQRRVEWSKKVTLAQEYWTKKLQEVSVPKEEVDSIFKEKGYLFGNSVNLVMVYFEDPLRGKPIRKMLRNSRRYRRFLRSLAKDPSVSVEWTGWVNLGYLFYEYQALPFGVESLVVKMNKGSVSPVISTKGGNLVFRLLGKKKVEVDTVEVKKVLTQVLLDKRRKELEDSLERKLRDSFPVWTGGLVQ